VFPFHHLFDLPITSVFRQVTSHFVRLMQVV
jgi:hypothetical protein